ncbi:MAG: nuclear transport factor 2 family protein [Chryseobacterium sp.]|nr:MAG: nuclear transport factor 2 family protein [Chryseobacterium sp.]
MKIGKSITIFCVAILLLSCSQKPNTGEAEQEVKTAHEKRRVETLNGNWEAVSSMMADDLTFTHANAVVEDKTQFIDALKSKRLRYRKLADENLKVRVHDNTGVVSGICHIVVDASGTTIDLRVEFTELWVKKDNKWSMLLWHATQVP